MDEDLLSRLQTLVWMPSRIPIQDALVADVPAGVTLSADQIPPSHEQRWFPQEDGSLQLMVSYRGGAFDASIFRMAPKAWDHTTCDVCMVRIPPMTLCYVTASGSCVELCEGCYAARVLGRGSIDGGRE
jgi:hypothetical protein